MPDPAKSCPPSGLVPAKMHVTAALRTRPQGRGRLAERGSAAWPRPLPPPPLPRPWIRGKATHLCSKSRHPCRPGWSTRGLCHTWHIGSRTYARTGREGSSQCHQQRQGRPHPQPQPQPDGRTAARGSGRSRSLPSCCRWGHTAWAVGGAARGHTAPHNIFKRPDGQWLHHEGRARGGASHGDPCAGSGSCWPCPDRWHGHHVPPHTVAVRMPPDRRAA